MNVALPWFQALYENGVGLLPFQVCNVIRRPNHVRHIIDVDERDARRISAAIRVAQVVDHCANDALVCEPGQHTTTVEAPAGLPRPDHPGLHQIVCLHACGKVELAAQAKGLRHNLLPDYAVVSKERS